MVLPFWEPRGFGTTNQVGRGTPKWMVYNGKPGIKMDDLGGKPTISGNTQVAAAFLLGCQTKLRLKVLSILMCDQQIFMVHLFLGAMLLQLFQICKWFHVCFRSNLTCEHVHNKSSSVPRKSCLGNAFVIIREIDIRRKRTHISCIEPW